MRISSEPSRCTERIVLGASDYGRVTKDQGLATLSTRKTTQFHRQCNEATNHSQGSFWCYMEKIPFSGNFIDVSYCHPKND